jgi:hypothetical protein
MPKYTVGPKEQDVPPEGDYDFIVDDATEKESRQANAMIELQLVIEHNGSRTRVFDYLVFTPRAFWKIDHFLSATGEKLVEGQEFTLEAEDCIGRKGRCHLIVDNYQGEARNKVDDYLWPVTSPAKPATLSKVQPKINYNELGEPDDIPF